MKWTAFDPDTASALAASVSDVSHAQTKTGELDSALDNVSSTPSAVLAPARDGNHTLLMMMRSRDDIARASARDAAPDDHPSGPTSYEAGGFLGLADEPVYDDKKPRR